MGYKVEKNEDGDILGCDCCDSEVATELFNDDRSQKRLCVFCSNAIGRRNDAVTKAILAQMFNELLKELKP